MMQFIFKTTILLVLITAGVQKDAGAAGRQQNQNTGLPDDQNPVFSLTLVSFDYSLENANFIDFKWVTNKEVDVEQMQLQGSADGKTFNVLSIEVATNTGLNHSYMASVSNSAQYNYYRLAIVNENGKTDYSQVLHVATVPSAVQDINIFPNPITNLTFTLEVPTTQQVTVNVYSMKGRLLYSVNLQDQSRYLVRLPAYAASENYLAIQVIDHEKSKTFNVLNK